MPYSFSLLAGPTVQSGSARSGTYPPAAATTRASTWRMQPSWFSPWPAAVSARWTGRLLRNWQVRVAWTNSFVHVPPLTESTLKQGLGVAPKAETMFLANIRRVATGGSGKRSLRSLPMVSSIRHRQGLRKASGLAAATRRDLPRRSRHAQDPDETHHRGDAPGRAPGTRAGPETVAATCNAR